ncbi:tRNA pseudouridine(55) synthase TruB [Pseudidiomarina aestuarii]|uniref:tRNA pseudouridine synthase B n=2 Tax=Pseudidiomarina aestuarii TaxID=624146 RepID=A0A7Z7ETT4_9GAMM|nr:tRNA pseudouridine(55) synthase TruB [Pseudidiomarina aestuarii]RUO41407.1 tRNA pseudouridine(55) synthase TruB [Pseudidiomarina aestuarii]
MGRRKSGRDVSGVILLDKPLAVTSNAALQQVRRFFNANKAGHTGALDPLATGLLPLCFGEATKVSHFALEADKTYQVTAQLGVRTTTSDAEGEVVSQQAVTVDATTIRSLLPEFEGEQRQSPSMYSALKYEGRPLYYYARMGIEVPRKTRTIHIRSIQFLDFSNDQLKLEVTCSKGTYIRTLIDDLGQRLGCGAHVAALHRTWIEGVEGPWITIEELAALAPDRDAPEPDYTVIEAQLQPNDCVIQQLPTLCISGAEVGKFCSGNPARWPLETEVGVTEFWRIVRQEDGCFLGIGWHRDGQVIPKRVLNGIPLI